VFIFRIQGTEDTDTADVDLTLTVEGDNSVTVTKLPVGRYIISELTDWSWRYENVDAVREIHLTYNNGTNEIIYENSRQHAKWLDGNATKNNQF
jgi:hypothetical protein